MAALEAIKLSSFKGSKTLPFSLRHIPPASFTKIIPATISQRFNLNDQNPSNFPDATFAKSRAEDPCILTLVFL